MGLPSGYKRLEYIQSSGTQYIDTQFFPNQNTRLLMDIDVATMVNAYGYSLFGTRGEIATYMFYLLASGTTDSAERWQSGFGTVYDTGVGSFSRAGRHKIDKNRDICKIDDLSITTSSSDFTAVNSLTLLAMHQNSGINGALFCSGKLYSCQIYDNGNLIRDFIPCQTTSGEIGLWDDVNSVFYGNAGTGTFMAGPVVASPSIFVNIDGIWKPINNIYANINNIWRELT